MDKITLTYTCGHSIAVSPEQAQVMGGGVRMALQTNCLPCKMRGAGFDVRHGEVVGIDPAAVKRHKAHVRKVEADRRAAGK